MNPNSVNYPVNAGLYIPQMSHVEALGRLSKLRPGIGKYASTAYQEIDYNVSSLREGANALRESSSTLEEHGPKSATEQKIRKCLICRSPFPSAWAGERICRRCKSSAAWRSGVLR
jgi:hypothetical protein